MTVPLKASFYCCAIPARVLEVECTLTGLSSKDMLCENSILLNFAILCCLFHAAFFGCICRRIRKQFEVKIDMVAKVFNESVRPVRVFCPLNVGGAFGFGSINIDIGVLLWFCVTFPWHGMGVRKKNLTPQKKAATTYN